MPEFFTVANSFAAPFVSDQSTQYVEASNAREALEILRETYSHPCGLYGATVYASADDWHKRGHYLGGFGETIGETLLRFWQGKIRACLGSPKLVGTPHSVPCCGRAWMQRRRNHPWSVRFGIRAWRAPLRRLIVPAASRDSAKRRWRA